MPQEDKIPSFEEVMGANKTSSKVPSFEEVMGKQDSKTVLKSYASDKPVDTAFDFEKSKNKIDSLNSKIKGFNSKIKQNQLSDEDKRSLRSLEGELAKGLGSMAIEGSTSEKLKLNDSIVNYNSTIEKIGSISKKYKSLTSSEQKDYDETLKSLNAQVTEHNSQIEKFKKNQPTVMGRMFGDTRPEKQTGDISQLPGVKKSKQNTIMPELEMQMAAKAEGVGVTLAKWAKQNNVDLNSPKAKEQKKKYENGLSNGDYVVTLDADGNRSLGRSAGAIDSYIMGLHQSNVDADEASMYRGASDEELVKHLNKKMTEPQELIPTVSRGALNEFSLAAGGATRMIGKQGLGASLAEGTALFFAPETFGASLMVLGVLGGSTAIAKDMMNGAYKSEIEKYYKQGKDEGLSDLDAVKKARIQGERASAMSIPEILGYSVAGNAVGKIFPGAVGNDGLKTGFVQALKKIAPEAIGTSAVASGSAIAKDLSAAQLGYKVEAKTMVYDALNSASDNLKFMAGLMSVHGVANKLTSMSKPLYSQLKSYVNSAEKGVPETVLNNLKENGAIKPEEADKTIQALKSHEKAKEALATLKITDEALAGSLEGKQEKKMKLQNDIKELQKQNVTIGISEKEAEIAKIDEEMKNIYETGKIDEHEIDSDIPDFQPEVKPEVKEEYVPTDEHIEANMNATPEQRIEAEKQARLTYEEELKTKQNEPTGSTTEDKGAPIEVSGDVLRELGESGRKLTEDESGAVRSKIAELGGNDAARKLFDKEGHREYGESFEAYLVRKLC